MSESKRDLYKYYCKTEQKFIYERVEIYDPVPTVCKNSSGHIVDWDTLSLFYKAPRKSTLGLKNLRDIKDSVDSNRAPTNNDDKRSDFIIGSRWVNRLTNEIYICVDNKIDNAVWEKISGNTLGSNIGNIGIGIYKNKVGETIQFKKINQKSNKISIVDDNENNKIDIDVEESNIIINSLSGAPSSKVMGVSDGQTVTNKVWGDNLDMNGNKITNLLTPTSNSDCATKGYVDSVVSGLDIKDSVLVSSTKDLNSNSSISGSIIYNSTAGPTNRGQITTLLSVTDLFTIDGINLHSENNGSRILLKDQDDKRQNGIWILNISGTLLTLDRSTDFDDNTDNEVTGGAFMFVEQGESNSNTGWIITTNNPVIVGGLYGTEIPFTQFSGGSHITAGKGIIKNGNSLNVGGSETIIANANNLQINSSNLINQILLSSGTVGKTAYFGSLPLGHSNSVSGVLRVQNGGSGATYFSSGYFLEGNGSSAITASKVIPNGAVVGTTDTQILYNKTINTSNNSITVLASDVVDGVFDDARISESSVVQHQNSISIDSLIGSPVGSVVGTSDIQTLSEKTFILPKINDMSNNYKYMFKVNELNEDRNITLPLLSNDDIFVFKDHPQLLKNKVISSLYNTVSISTSDVIDGTFSDARISESSITQHERAINHNNLSGYVLEQHLDWTKDQSNYSIHPNNIAQTSITQHERSININNLNGSPKGLVIGSSDTQTLTNKTIDTEFNNLSISANDINSGTLSDERISSSSVIQYENLLTISNLIGSPNSQVVGTTDTQTLTNKTFTDLYTFFQDNIDNTKKMQFQLSNISSNTTRTFNFPNTDTTLVGINSSQTLTNKTINGSSNAITIDASNVTTGLFANARIQASNVVQHESSININNLLNSPVGDIVGTTDNQTLTNKTIDSSNNTLSFNADVLKSGSLSNSRVVASNITQHEGSINHNNLLNYSKNRHIDHTEVDIIAGEGLSGGGNIASSRTVSLGINLLTTDPNPDSSSDYVAVYDSSKNNHKKVLISNLIGSAGETNTASNVGTDGVGIYKQKVGSNLQFKKINPTSTKLSVTDDTESSKIDIDVVEARINHDNLGGFVANEHINHSLINIDVGIGLTGGGDLTTSRTISFDFPSLNSDENPSGATDFVITYDSSANTYRKVLLNDLPGAFGFVSRKFDAYYDPINEVTVNHLWVDVPLHVNRILDSDFSHSEGSAEVTINSNDTYEVVGRVSTYASSGNNRTQTQMRLLIDRGSGYSQIPGSLGFMYNRERIEGYNSATVNMIMPLKVGDKVKIQAIRTSGNSIIKLVDEGCSLVIHNV
jgi:hypothetical protein